MCHYFSICGGNTRVRAQQLTGDAWAEDPGCYLRDDEIGLQAGSDAQRVALTPFSKGRRTIADRIHPDPKLVPLTELEDGTVVMKPEDPEY